MKPSTELVQVKEYRIHVEQYRREGNRKSIILINGALATTGSFNHCVKYLRDDLDIILFDLPFTGQSRPHNPAGGIVTKDEEVEILLALIDRYRPQSMLSVSWGGYAAMMALARRPPSIERAVVASFSSHLNEPMRNYVSRARDLVRAERFGDVAKLMNDEVGRFLPKLLKHVNHRHLSSLDSREYHQACFHIEQILSLDDEDYTELYRKIDVPVLFINGELDEHTSPAAVRELGNYIDDSRFCTLPDAGHFLDLENRSARRRMQQVLKGFLMPVICDSDEPSSYHDARFDVVDRDMSYVLKSPISSRLQRQSVGG
ncbi:MAG: alpha/beta hydrolase [Salinicola sp.]|uniref:alpha/beta fold hydrolase n=1 Tax=Salinicola sp. TaxID=1978524 RepID=UPI001D70B086|nr:alpha/beta hydrolase [Salinicola sp.]NRB55884.1 alpha/beta hydrolase [Salinicola sp.]